MRKILVLLAALAGGWLAHGSSALADTCCRGFYVEGVILGGGGFIGDLRSVGPTTGLLKDDSAQDSVAGGGAAIGFNWKKLGAPIRTEIEWAHIVRLDYDSRPIFTNNLPQAGFENNVSTTTIMLNVNYDFDVGYSWFRPYAGFGVGYARNKSDVNFNNFAARPGPNGETKVNQEFTTSNLAWALTAGGEFDFNQNWFAHAAYRFIHTGEIEAGNTAAGVLIEGDTIYRHELRLGFGYRF